MVAICRNQVKLRALHYAERERLFGVKEKTISFSSKVAQSLFDDYAPKDTAVVEFEEASSVDKNLNHYSIKYG